MFQSVFVTRQSTASPTPSSVLLHLPRNVVCAEGPAPIGAEHPFLFQVDAGGALGQPQPLFDHPPLFDRQEEGTPSEAFEGYRQSELDLMDRLCHP